MGFCYLDRNLRYIVINEWLAKINGLTVEEHIGRTISELFPDLAVVIEPQFQAVLDTGNPVIKGRVFAETSSHNGDKRLFEHNYFADKSADGIVQGVSCFVEDISERERAWEKLKESENKFKTLVDSVKAVPWRFDLKKNRFTYIGKQVESLLGYPVSYWVDFDSWSSCIHTDDRNKAVKFCMNSTAKGLDHDFEYRCVNADGNIVWLRDVVALRKDDTGVPFELIGYMIDITERKLLEEKVSQYNSHLEKLVAERTSELQTSNLASQLEHELNLNRLKDYSSRLRKLTSHMTEVAERERKSIARDLHDDLGQVLTSLGIEVAILKNKVLSSSDFHGADSMAEDLVTMSDTIGSASKRLHGFVSKLRPEVLDNLGLITSLKLQADEFSKTHKIECEFVSNLERIDINGNVAIAIYRIAQECLTNIARHSNAKKSQLKVEVVNNSFVIEVSDDGVGISTETLNSTDRFGLMGIKERASGLNGEVQIDSALGKGTKIRTTIPIDSGGVDGD